MKDFECYDILNRAKQKGQSVLIELPRISRKDNPLLRVKAKELECKEHRGKVEQMGELYTYAKEHPELCPPIGTVIKIRNQYGVKAKITVKDIFAGMPGTTFELLPLEEQPEHLRDKALLDTHTKDCGRPRWVQWADTDAWQRWQEIKDRNERL